jgi:hypothetical protein
MARYAIYKGSQSANGFSATVVDTTKPDIIGGKHYQDKRTGQFHYDAVCECFSDEDAALVCKALNALHEAVDSRT